MSTPHLDFGSDLLKCAQCGEPIPHNQKFCPNCGAQLNPVHSQPSAPIGMPGLGIYAGGNGIGAFIGTAMSEQSGSSNHSCNDTQNIHSSIITEFSTNFFVYDKEDQSLSGSYYFKLKQENGKLVLHEDYKYCIQEEVTPDVFVKIQKIIIDHNLIALNGKYDVKQGLPAECQPCHLKAVYDSGEVLNFTMNSIPYIPWAQELAFLLRTELAKRGHKECLAPKSATNIINFRINFRDGDLDYSYGMINDKKYIERFIFNNLKNNIESRKYIEVGERFYAELHEYIYSHGLNCLHTAPGLDYDWKVGKPQYYDIYIGYENRKTIVCRSNDAGDCDAFYKKIPELKAFLDRYIDDPNAVVRTKEFFIAKPFSLDLL